MSKKFNRLMREFSIVSSNMSYCPTNDLEVKDPVVGIEVVLRIKTKSGISSLSSVYVLDVTKGDRLVIEDAHELQHLSDECMTIGRFITKIMFTRSVSRRD